MAARLTQAQIQQMIDAALDQANQANLVQRQQIEQQLIQANAQIAQMQAQQAAQQEAIQAGAAVQQPAVQPAVPAPVVFALSPGTAVGQGVNNLIDYNTKAGVEVAKTATLKLSVAHDLDREHLNGFLEALRNRAIQQGWYDGIFRVVQNGIELNIVESYGTLTRAAIDAAARARIFADTRHTQDTITLFASLEETLTQEARDTLYTESANYTTYRWGDTQVPVVGNADDKRRDGMMFLWTIINRTTAWTNATITVIIHQLNHLEAVMTEENSNITAFNTKVRKLLNSYYANKRVTFDKQVLLTNLADAYKTCKDTEFVMYVNRKWQDHIDESNPITSTELMELALKQYQTMLEQSKWCVESKQTKQIMNLTSQIGNLKKWKNEKEKEKKNINDKKDGEKQFVNAAQWR
jgi:hypothetical protein